jgi:hypothetical protein
MRSGYAIPTHERTVRRPLADPQPWGGSRRSAPDRSGLSDRVVVSEDDASRVQLLPAVDPGRRRDRRVGRAPRAPGEAGATVPSVIVWIASFPRSGNTFLRIVLNRRYGVRTSTVYDVDGVAVRLGADLIGFEERPATFDAMREAQEVHFVKTHRPRDDRIHETDRAVCLVRDGRDSLVSWARLVSERDDRRYETELREMITRPTERGAGGWGRNVLSWLQPQVPHRVVLRYEDLTREPGSAVEKAVTALLPELRLVDNATIPSFSELQQVDRRFFRSGFSGTHRGELPEELAQIFWSQPENAAAMKLLGCAE